MREGADAGDGCVVFPVARVSKFVVEKEALGRGRNRSPAAVKARTHRWPSRGHEAQGTCPGAAAVNGALDVPL